MVYGHLLHETEPIEITSFKEYKDTPREAIHAGIHGPRAVRPRYQHSVLRVCKQMFAEASPIFYGDNQFSFTDPQELDIFLNQIGPMRKFLKSIKFRWFSSDFRAKRGNSFDLLADASNLRKLEIDRDVFNRGWRQFPMTIKKLVKMLKPAMTQLQEQREATDAATSVLDIVRFKWTPWQHNCLNPKAFGLEHRQCPICRAAPAHCELLNAIIRFMLAEALKIDDLEGSQQLSRLIDQSEDEIGVEKIL